MASIRTTYPFLTCSNSSSQECSICLDEYKNVSFVDPCLHKFCFTCILQWSELNSKCPICRTRFTNILHNVRNDKDFDSMIVSQPSHGHHSLLPDDDEVSASEVDGLEWSDVEDVWETPSSDVEEFVDGEDIDTDNVISISSNSSDHLFDDYNSDTAPGERVTVDVYNMEFRRIMEMSEHGYNSPNESTADASSDFNIPVLRQTQTPSWPSTVNQNPVQGSNPEYEPSFSHVEYFPIEATESQSSTLDDMPSTRGSTSSVAAVDWRNTDVISVPSRSGSTLTLTNTAARKRGPDLETDNKTIKHFRQSSHF